MAAAELAGFLAAHSIWVVSEGDMDPAVMYATASGERHLDRFSGDPGDMLAIGQRRLRDNPMNAVVAALAFVRHAPAGQGEGSAVLIDLRAYSMPEARLRVAILFSRADGRLCASKGRVVASKNCESLDKAEVMRAFMKGVAAHEKGWAVWKRSLAQPN